MSNAGLIYLVSQGLGVLEIPVSIPYKAHYTLSRFVEYLLFQHFVILICV